MGLSWSRHKLHPVISTLSAHELKKETHYYIKLHLAVLKYCAIALQAAVEEKLRIVDDYIFDVKILTKIITKMKNIKSIILKRNNTIEDPEFKQALSDLNPDVIYEKLKVICKRNPKRQAKWRYPSPAELPVDIFYDSDKLMRTISLFFMDNKMDNYKIDPDNQMYFMDITGLRVVIRNCSLFEKNPKWHLWQKERKSVIFEMD